MSQESWKPIQHEYSKFMLSLSEYLTGHRGIDFSDAEVRERFDSLDRTFPLLEEGLNVLRSSKTMKTVNQNAVTDILELVTRYVQGETGVKTEIYNLLAPLLMSSERYSFFSGKVGRWLNGVGRAAAAVMIGMLAYPTKGNAESTNAQAAKIFTTGFTGVSALSYDRNTDEGDDLYRIGGGAGPDPDAELDDANAEHHDDHHTDIEGEHYSCGADHNPKTYRRCAAEEALGGKITGYTPTGDAAQGTWIAKDEAGHTVTGTYKQQTVNGVKRYVSTVDGSSRSTVDTPRAESHVSPVANLEMQGNRKIIDMFRSIHRDDFYTSYNFNVDATSHLADRSAVLDGTGQLHTNHKLDNYMAITAHYKLQSIKVVETDKKGDKSTGKIKLRYVKVAETPFAQVARTSAMAREIDLANSPDVYEREDVRYTIEGGDIKLDGSWARPAETKPRHVAYGTVFLEGDFEARMGNAGESTSDSQTQGTNSIPPTTIVSNSNDIASDDVAERRFAQMAELDRDPAAETVEPSVEMSKPGMDPQEWAKLKASPARVTYGMNGKYRGVWDTEHNGLMNSATEITFDGNKLIARAQTMQDRGGYGTFEAYATDASCREFRTSQGDRIELVPINGQEVLRITDKDGDIRDYYKHKK